jgi:hypothetical protein
MSIAAGFPSVKKPRFNIDLGEERQTTEGDASQFATAADNLYMAPRPSFAC